MTAAPRVALVNLGCRVNRVELDVMAAALKEAGCSVVDEGDADIVVVNTCAVTGEAEAKARKAVRRAAGLPGVSSVVATGCVASLFADELAELAGNVCVEPLKSSVAKRVLELAERLPDRETPDPVADGDGSVTPTGRMRPGVKIQDGCDNRCTYCIVWKARGPARSVPVDDVVAQVAAEVAHGAGEVMLTGIDLGRYRDGSTGLAGLVETLLEKTAVGRLRLGSIEPAGVDDALLSVMAASEGRVAPYLHIPLQAGCDETLARMGRPYGTDEYLSVVEHARERVDGLAVACDLIVGFPGETEEEFAQSLAFAKECAFSRMHVFRYSKRPGTWAASAPGQVEPQVMAERSRAMRALAASMARDYAKGRVGRPNLVYVERPGRAVSGGLVEVEVPEVLEVGAFATVVPHGITTDGRLDAR